MMSPLIDKIKSWKYTNLGISLDGGTLSIFFTDPMGESRVVTLGQHVIAEYYEELSDPPARIYIDKKNNGKRSDIETSLIQFLENEVSIAMANDEMKLLTERLSFIKSDAYLNYEPIKLELSEKRKKYLKSINNDSSE